MNQLTTFDEQQSPSQSAALMLFDAPRMHALMDFAKMMASSAVTVPDHLRGKPSDCMAIAMQAIRWGMDPFVVAQKTHVVSGRLGYEAQLVNAVVQSSNAITGSFHYEFDGEGQNLQCRVGAVLRGEHEVTWGEWLRCGDVTTKNSPLWKVNPKQQMGYLQVKNWARLYCPGAILGVYTQDELADSPPKDMGSVDEVEKPRGPQRKSAAPAPALSVESKPDQETQPADVVEPVKQQMPQPTAASMGPVIGPGQLAYLRNKLKQAGLDESSICARFEVGALEGLSVDQFDEVKAELLAMA